MPEDDEFEVEVPMQPEAWEGFQGAGPEGRYTEDPVYNQAIHKALLCETEYGSKGLVSAIDHAPLFLESKIALVSIVAGKFDKTEILAKQNEDGIAIAKLDLEIIITQALLAMPECDREKSELINIVNMLRDHYDKFVSRSVNAYERDLQNRIETSNTQTMVQKLVGPKPPKRGFKLPLMGG